MSQNRQNIPSMFNDHPKGPRNWLITGGCGFIGCNLIKNLVCEKQIRIRIIDNLSVGSTADLKKICRYKKIDPNTLSAKEGQHRDVTTGNPAPQVELLVGDIRDPEITRLAAQGMDVIIHLAANTDVFSSIEDPWNDMQSNVSGTLNMLEAARYNKVKRFVYASSIASIGEFKNAVHEEVPAHPISPYGAGKVAGESYCSAYFRTYGIETVALRFSNVYGPFSNHKKSCIAAFIRNILEKKPVHIYGDGTQTRDFIYIDDLVYAITFSAEKKDIGGEIFQIATNTETSINSLLEKLIRIHKVQINEDIQIHYQGFRPGDIRRSRSTFSKASQKLGWQFKTQLDDGLESTFQWFLKEKEKMEIDEGINS